MNFVYDHPSVAALTDFITQLASLEGDGHKANDNTARVDDMIKLVDKYTAYGQFESRVPLVGKSPDGMVVTLTGSTGGLGSVLLSKLLTRDDVVRVFAINRCGTISLKDRQERAFMERGLDVTSLTSAKLVLLEGDLCSERLGLEEETYEDVGVAILDFTETCSSGAADSEDDHAYSP